MAAAEVVAAAVTTTNFAASYFGIFNFKMINQLINKFATSTVLVIGDVMIDAYLKGSVGRISPEAPVPIVDVEERYYRLGGAANVAINLQSLGATPLLCSVIGNDEKSHEFLSLMKEHGLATDCLYHSGHRKNTASSPMPARCCAWTMKTVFCWMR